MALQDTMVPSTSAHTRSRRKSAPSELSLVDLLSRSCAPCTDNHCQLPSPSRGNFEIFYPSEYHNLNKGPSNHSKSNSSCPSPPSTDSHCGGCIVFPPLIDLDSPQHNSGLQSIETFHFGGVLDSPLLMYHSFLKSQAPLSPPLTLPTSTLCLPLAECEDYRSSTFCDAHDLPDQEDISDFRSLRLDALTSSSRSSCSTLQSSPPLSPVSPNSADWCPHSVGFSSAHQAPISSRSGISPGNNDDRLPVLYRDLDDNLLHDQSLDKLGIVSLDHSAFSLLNTQLPKSPGLCPEYGEPLFTDVIFHSPKSILQDLDPIDFDDSPLLPLPFPSPDPEANHQISYRQETPTDRIQELNQPPPTQPEGLKGEYRDGPTPFSHTWSPITRTSNLPELDDVYDMDLDFRDFSRPCSPSRRTSTVLPDDDQEGSSPSSHSDSDRDALNDTIMLSPPGSPALNLLSLPGADTDEDLIPVDLAPTKLASAYASPLYPNRLLGLDDDDSTPRSSSSLRSPSPEPCVALDISLLAPQMPQDKELRKLCGLMKRMKDKEKVARQMENLIEEEESVTRSISGSSSTAAVDAWNKLVDARGKARRLKEKVREVGTLLRVKLAQRGWKISKDGLGKPILVPTSPKRLASAAGSFDESEDAMKMDFSPRLPKQPRITSAPQLLAKMVMDRHEPKYNPCLRAGLPLNRRVTSPLSQTSLLASDMDLAYYERDEDNSRTESIEVSTDNLDVKMSDLLQDLDLGMEIQSIP